MNRLLSPAAPILALLALPFLALSGCGGDAPATAPQGINLDGAGAPANGRYPLEPGWSWTYVTTLSTFDLDDSTQASVAVDTVRVEALGEVDLGTTTAYGLVARTVQTGPSGEELGPPSEVYYQQRGSGLVEIAYRGFSLNVQPAPRTGNTRTYHLGTRTFNSLRELSRALLPIGPSTGWLDGEADAGRNPGITAAPGDDPILFRDQPRQALVYPLRAGASWVSFTDPWTQTRRVAGHGPAHVPGGTFGSALIRTQVGIDPDLTWVDWISPQGLAARELRGVYTILQGGPAGAARGADFVIKAETVLLDYSRPRGRP